MAELSVKSIAQHDLESPDAAEHQHGDVGVPVVQGEGLPHRAVLGRRAVSGDALEPQNPLENMEVASRQRGTPRPPSNLWVTRPT